MPKKISKKKSVKEKKTVKKSVKEKKTVKKSVKGKGATKNKKQVKTVKFMGADVKYINKINLAQKLKTSVPKIEQLIGTEPVNRYIYNKDGDFGRQDLREKPLIARDFGIKRIIKDDILKPNHKIKKIDIKSELPSNIKLRLVLSITVHLLLKKIYQIERNIVRSAYITSEEIEHYVLQIVDQYIDMGFGHDEAEIDDYAGGIQFIVRSEFSDQKFQIIDRILKKKRPLNLSNKFDNIDINDNDDCARFYLKNKLKGFPGLLKQVHSLGNSDGITARQIITFCKKNDLSIQVYNIENKIEEEYKPKNGRRIKHLKFLAYDGHLYPINGELKKKEITYHKVEIIKHAETTINNILENNERPENIIFDGVKIISFIHENIKYIENKEYNDCKNILSLFSLEDQIYDAIKLKHLPSIIEKKYNISEENIDSFIPNNYIFVKGGFNFQTDNEFDVKKVKTIDKNLAYSNSLMKLDFLISTDIRTAKINKTISKIVPHNLYIAFPKFSSILLPDTNVYSGQHLLYCKTEGISFKILEELECNSHYNFYRKMLDTMHKFVLEGKMKRKEHFKEMIVRMIGTFEAPTSTKIKCVVKDIVDNDDKDRKSGCYKEISNKYNLWYEMEERVVGIYNRKPIAIQIKDKCREILYEKMKSMNLFDKDIIKITTDSISYIGKYPTNLDKNDINGWKKETFKEFRTEEKIHNKLNIRNKKTLDEFFDDSPRQEIKQEYYGNNSTLSFSDIPKVCDPEIKSVICMNRAGCGKTTDIINNVIPNIKHNKYIILSPSYTTIKEYKKLGHNCNVIQAYSLNNTAPKEKVVIIDEFGMCDKKAHEVLYKCILLKKECYVYGDFFQLKPVGEPRLLNEKLYLNTLFNEMRTMTDNFRNNFTPEYYTSLINGEVNYKEEVIKHSTSDYTKADIIFCWKNETVKKYNDLMLSYLNLKFGDIGCKVICKTNKLKNLDIYNAFEYIIKDIEEEFIILDNDTKIKKTQLKYFLPGYARTIYGYQGASVKSYYFAKDDINFVNTSAAYTIISRLQQDKI